MNLGINSFKLQPAYKKTDILPQKAVQLSFKGDSSDDSFELSPKEQEDKDRLEEEIEKGKQLKRRNMELKAKNSALNMLAFGVPLIIAGAAGIGCYKSLSNNPESRDIFVSMDEKRADFEDGDRIGTVELDDKQAKIGRTKLDWSDGFLNVSGMDYGKVDPEGFSIKLDSEGKVLKINDKDIKSEE